MQTRRDALAAQLHDDKCVRAGGLYDIDNAVCRLNTSYPAHFRIRDVLRAHTKETHLRC